LEETIDLDKDPSTSLPYKRSRSTIRDERNQLIQQEIEAGHEDTELLVTAVKEMGSELAGAIRSLGERRDENEDRLVKVEEAMERMEERSKKQEEAVERMEERSKRQEDMLSRILAHMTKQ
jgi:SMC interacting uncharacterized protein involved in chromosome segregation